ncbi:MAG: V-type ATP synthase subunit H [Spirochaetes bacterium]|nr:V-type ATP synthase subunit H [Spirochaetota bacterium]
MPSREILDRLVDVERRAEILVDEARAEADRRIGEARDIADARYKSAYENEAKRLEAGRKAALASIDEGTRAEIDGYRETLESVPFDETAFKAACEAWLSGLT